MIMYNVCMNIVYGDYWLILIISNLIRWNTSCNILFQIGFVGYQFSFPIPVFVLILIAYITEITVKNL